jgi:hypothetical protein
MRIHRRSYRKIVRLIQKASGSTTGLLSNLSLFLPCCFTLVPCRCQAGPFQLAGNIFCCYVVMWYSMAGMFNAVVGYHYITAEAHHV